MKPEQQRIAIAEACGWTISPFGESISNCPKTWRTLFDLPDYLNDLNAMNEAEKTLSPGQASYYACVKLPGGVFDGVHASAAQRAEAFLRTIGKWVES